MTDRSRENDATLNPEPGPGQAPRPDKDRASGGPERDFGDSAGYGSGGSALDYHEVGDEDASPIKGRRNPLDDVVETPSDRGEG